MLIALQVKKCGTFCMGLSRASYAMYPAGMYVAAIDDGGRDHDLAVPCISPMASYSDRWNCIPAVLYFYIISYVARI